MQAATLVLRDIHQPAAPPWWPPAPGWWLLVALALLVLAVWWWFAARKRRQRRRMLALFDEALAGAETSAEQVATMSELLRRAARRRDPTADRLHGEAWLAFLDGVAAPSDTVAGKPVGAKPVAMTKHFSQGPGRLLLEGGYRREVDPVQVAQLQPIVRARFLQLMATT